MLFWYGSGMKLMVHSFTARNVAEMRYPRHVGIANSFTQERESK
jgi:hypothetical protein